MTLIQSYDPSWPLYSLLTIHDPFKRKYPEFKTVYALELWTRRPRRMDLENPAAPSTLYYTGGVFC